MKTIALFSGGKDSTYAIHLAREETNIDELLTIQPRKDDSMMYHTTALTLTEATASALDIPHRVLLADSEEDELRPLRDLLRKEEVEALIHGAIQSNYQKSRIQSLCEDHGVKEIAPLWMKEHRELLSDIADELMVIITAVAADGLDRDWIGRRLDYEAIKQLEELNEEKGIHLLGEGGEYETAVLNAPMMNHGLEVEYKVKWEGIRGELIPTEITEVDR